MFNLHTYIVYPLYTYTLHIAITFEGTTGSTGRPTDLGIHNLNNNDDSLLH